MKSILYILFTLILFSCSGNKEDRIPKQTSNKIKLVQDLINKPKSELQINDSLQYFLKLTNGYNQIPVKFYKKYLKIEKTEFDTNFSISGSLDNRFKTLKDYYVVFFSISRDGICSSENVATISKTGKLIGLIEMIEECDKEQSYASTYSNSYEILDSVTIKITESVSEPKDKNTVDRNGFFYDSINNDEVKMVISDTSYYIKIKQTGIFEKSSIN